MENKKAIEEFAKDISCLDEIYKELSKINFFEILKIDQVEIRHSNMLAWLLNPNSESGIGDKLLKKLVYYCAENATNQKNYLSSTEIEVMDFDDLEVEREKATDKNKRIDLLINSPQSGLVVCIENKINSSERKDTDDSEGQLSQYKKYVEQKYNDPKYKYIFCVFLTPNGLEASGNNADQWIAMSYNEIFDWLKSIANTYGTSINKKALLFIDEYLESLSRNVIDTDLKIVCDRIYRKHIDAFRLFEVFRDCEVNEKGNKKEAERELYRRHKQAIDFILSKKTSLLDLIKEEIRAGIEAAGYKAEFKPNRVPIYIKSPYQDVDESIVKANETWSYDYLYYQIYCVPSSGMFYLHLYTNPKNLPEESLRGKVENALQIIGNKRSIIRKINAKNQLSSTRLNPGLKLEDYEEYLKNNKDARPSKDDDFIKKIVNNAINTIKGRKHKPFWDALK